MEESRERSRIELKHHIDETLEQLGKEQKREREKMAHTVDNLYAMLGAAIKAVRDPDTQLKVKNAVHAELTRLRAVEGS
jgi:hypothetical protein